MVALRVRLSVQSSANMYAAGPQKLFRRIRPNARKTAEPEATALYAVTLGQGWTRVGSTRGSGRVETSEMQYVNFAVFCGVSD